jgi:hypothetical protein
MPKKLDKMRVGSDKGAMAGHPDKPEDLYTNAGDDKLVGSDRSAFFSVPERLTENHGSSVVEEHRTDAFLDAFVSKMRFKSVQTAK